MNIYVILNPTDYSERSDIAFRIACSLARDYQAQLVLLHAALRSVAIEGEASIARRSEEYFQAERKQLDGVSVPAAIRVERLMREGDPAGKILRAVQFTNADLIVMGTHRRTGLTRLLRAAWSNRCFARLPAP